MTYQTCYSMVSVWAHEHVLNIDNGAGRTAQFPKGDGHNELPVINCR